MATNIIMPQGGQDLVEGKVLRWLRAEGEPVRKGEVICEVETEKAAFDVEAPEDGVLLKIVADPGETVPILSVIGVVGKAGEQVVLPAPAPAAAMEASAAPVGLDVAAIRGRLGKGAGPAGDEVRISGRARRLAEERGIDLRTLRGTGPGGRVTEKDVLAHGQGPDAAGPAPAAQAAEPPARGKAVPLSRRRSAIARRMQQSKQTVPHFYVTVATDMGEALRLREELNAEAVRGAAPKISVNDMVAKAVALALAEVPEVNSALRGEDLVLLEEINIGIAVGLDEGLVVPVLPAADRLSLRDVSTATRDLVAAVRAGKQPNLSVATFTISNMGMAGVESFSAIINPPEAAILAVGSIERQAAVGEDGLFRARDVMRMTLSADHRVIDGITAARFANQVKGHLENPRSLLEARA